MYMYILFRKLIWMMLTMHSVFSISFIFPGVSLMFWISIIAPFLLLHLVLYGAETRRNMAYCHETVDLRKDNMAFYDARVTCTVFIPYIIAWILIITRADSRFAPSQWETSLQSNTVSHWLGANLESALYNMMLYHMIWCTTWLRPRLLGVQTLVILNHVKKIIECIKF